MGQTCYFPQLSGPLKGGNEARRGEMCHRLDKEQGGQKNTLNPLDFFIYQRLCVHVRVCVQCLVYMYVCVYSVFVYVCMRIHECVHCKCVCVLTVSVCVCESVCV